MLLVLLVLLFDKVCIYVCPCSRVFRKLAATILICNSRDVAGFSGIEKLGNLEIYTLTTAERNDKTMFLQACIEGSL